MEDNSFPNNSESLFQETLNETSSPIDKLTNDNEEYKQTIHVLRRELDTKNAMFQEIRETWEENSAQQSQKIDSLTKKLTDKFNEERKVLQSRVKELEENMFSKVEEIQILQTEISDLKKYEKLPTIREESVYTETTEENDYKVKEILIILEEKETEVVQLEKSNNNLQDKITDLQTIIKDLRTRLEEKDQMLETAQEELINCRLELNSLKTAPVNNQQKGNSLFAEVEDRRQHMMEKMKSMRASYLEMQRSYKAKENEIKTLKLERATMLRQYEEAAFESAEQEDAVINAYTTRIRDLENQIKDEQKKYKELQKEQQSISNMSYLQNVLKSKKKEIEELQLQIENNSIRALLKEEFSYKIKSRLRYWKYKALSLEANLAIVQDQLKANPDYSTIEIQNLLKNQISNRSLKVEDEFEDEPEPSFKPEIVDETRFSLENLIQPKRVLQQTFDNTLTNMSLTTSVNNSCFDLNTTVVADRNKKIPSNLCKTLNFSKDMSVTETIGGSSSTDSLDETIVANPITKSSSQLSKTLNFSKDMSVTETIGGPSSTINLDETIVADPITKSSSQLSKTLNFTHDMSLTQPIPTNLNRTLKVEIDETEDFQPVFTSSRLDNASLRNLELDKENVSIAGNSTVLKSALSKSMKYPSEPKEKKVLRFTEDTVDRQGGYIRKLKEKQLNYPIVYISSEPKQ